MITAANAQQFAEAVSFEMNSAFADASYGSHSEPESSVGAAAVVVE